MASPHQPTLVYPDEFAITIPFGTPANWSSVYAHYKPEDDHDAQQFYTQAMDVSACAICQIDLILEF